MYAPCPHTTSASVWVAVGRPRATDVGGVVWWVLKRNLYKRYRRLQGENTMLLCKLTFCGRGVDQSRTKSSRVSDVRRGLFTYPSVGLLMNTCVR
jgi:hypothetical protein